MLTATELFVLLAVARLGADAYVVSIRADIAATRGKPASVAGVYAALDRLENHGLVRPKLSDPRPERGGRARRLFAITPAGRQRLEREHAAVLRTWHGVVPGVPGSRR